MTVREAENSARRLLESSWWTTPNRDAPLPVDPRKLARSLGIEIRIVPLPPDESGSIVIPTNGNVVISLNYWDSENRQRFTCAHEIGHYLRRSGQELRGRDRTFVDYRDTLAGLGRNTEEIYANQFAAAILMPAHLVQLYFNKGMTPEALADRFGTSTQAMNLRLRNLGLA